jgi:hypothetical protein
MASERADGHNACVALDEQARKLVSLVDDQRTPLAARIVQRMRAEIPRYRSYAVDDLHTAVELSIQVGVATLRDGGGVGGDSPLLRERFADLRRVRSQQGVDEASLARAVRIGAREVMDVVREVAITSAVDTASMLQLTTALWDMIEEMVSYFAPPEGGPAEVALRARADHDFVTAVVFGAPGTAVEVVAGRCGLDVAAAYHVVRATPAGEDVAAALRPARGEGAVATVDREVVAVLAALPAGDLPCCAGAGPAVPLASARHSHLVAGRALDAARAAGWSGLYRFEDVALRAAVAHDPLVTEALVARYLTPLHALGGFGDLLIASVRTYFECEQSVDDAARTLFVHPNTLRHRLSRFEEATGSSLRSVQQLAEIWWVLTGEPMSTP